MKHPRRTRLIRPTLQLRVILEFFGLAALGLLLQVVLLARRLPDAIAEAEATSGDLAAAIPDTLMQVMVSTFLILAPILFAFGIFFTFRIAGPVHRFEHFLVEVIRGEQRDACKIRKHDAFQGLCDLINDATEPLRTGAKPADRGASLELDEPGLGHSKLTDSERRAG